MKKYILYFKEMPRKEKIKFLLYVFIIISLFASLIYEIIMYFKAPGRNVVDSDIRTKSDYLLSIIMLVAVSVAMCIPIFLRRHFHLYIPYILEISFLIFFYCAVYLGEVRNFYYIVPHWDDILHSSSAIMLAIVGYSIVYLLNRKEIVKLTPFFISLFAFLFAFSIGSLWEVYEFICDSLFTVNSQKYALDDGTLLIGHAALVDTMKDIMVDCAGAFLTSALGYIIMKRKKVVSTKFFLHPESESVKTLTLTTELKKMTPEMIKEVERESKELNRKNTAPKSNSKPPRE